VVTPGRPTTLELISGAKKSLTFVPSSGPETICGYICIY
jgi:hypothetical protein